MKKKYECIVLERFEEIKNENKSLRAKIKILTEAVMADNREYLSSLKNMEEIRMKETLKDE
jgi:hypothetical protein